VPEQKFLLPTLTAMLVATHVSGIELVPGPCTITLGITQMFSALNHYLAWQRRVHKCGLKAKSEEACVTLPLVARCVPCRQHVACLLAVAMLARFLRGAGMFRSPAQIVCMACLSGGVAGLGYILILLLSNRGSIPTETQQLPSCGCWCQQEDGCLAGARCPYHSEFWPESEQHKHTAEEIQETEEEIQETEEAPMASLQRIFFGVQEDPFGNQKLEEINLDLLAEKASCVVCAMALAA